MTLRIRSHLFTVIVMYPERMKLIRREILVSTGLDAAIDLYIPVLITNTEDTAPMNRSTPRCCQVSQSVMIVWEQLTRACK